MPELIYFLDFIFLPFLLLLLRQKTLPVRSVLRLLHLKDILSEFFQSAFEDILNFFFQAMPVASFAPLKSSTPEGGMFSPENSLPRWRIYQTAQAHPHIFRWKTRTLFGQAALQPSPLWNTAMCLPCFAGVSWTPRGSSRSRSRLFPPARSTPATKSHRRSQVLWSHPIGHITAAA